VVIYQDRIEKFSLFIRFQVNEKLKHLFFLNKINKYQNRKKDYNDIFTSDEMMYL